MADLTYEDGYRAGLKFAITPQAQGGGATRKAAELGMMDVRIDFGSYGGPFICQCGYNLKDGVSRNYWLANVHGAPGEERMQRAYYIANAINFHEPLIEGLRDLAEAARNACDAKQYPALTEALFEADRLIASTEEPR